MKLSLTINGREDAIEILAPAPACRFQLGDGPTREADVEMANPGVYSILLDGRSYDVCVEDTPTGMVVAIEGHRFEIEARDPRRWSRKSGAAGAGAVQSILSPMPGKVIRVLAAPGDDVVPGQGIIVVEAMKMQSEFKATADRVVREILVKEGDTVSSHQVMMKLEE